MTLQNNNDYNNTRDLYIPEKAILTDLVHGQDLTTDWTLLGEVIKGTGLNKLTLCMEYRKGTGNTFQYKIEAIGLGGRIYPFPYDKAEASGMSHIPLIYYPKVDADQNIIREFRITPQYDYRIMVKATAAGGVIPFASIALGMYK